jgi:hypothetical protein
VRLYALVLLPALVIPATGEAQRWYGGSDFTEFNVPYDGRFTFVRLSYTPTSGMRGWGRRGRGRGDGLYWDHDYPIAEGHLDKLLLELTAVRPYMEGSNILSADDPELTKYPIAYVSEPGHWTLTDAEAEGLRNYLLQGGFLIFDDFAFPYEWAVFEEGIRLVLPEARLVRLDFSHDIFHSFFEIDSLVLHHPYRDVYAEFWGIFEDNDPQKRLMVIVNYNADIGDYWEFSDTGWLPIPLSNEAYKLGINYIVYAMTH